MACKASDADPAACLRQGDEVSGCVLSVLKDLNSKCKNEFNAYAKCMDYYSNDFESCRTEQKNFESSCSLWLCSEVDYGMERGKRLNPNPSLQTRPS